MPPDVSDVRKLTNLTPQTFTTHLSTRKLSHLSNEKTSRHHKLQISCLKKSPDLDATLPCNDKSSPSVKQRKHRTPTRTTEGDVPIGRKRRRSSASGAPGEDPHTISSLSEHLATCTDEQYNTVIYHLTKGWTATNERGNVVIKRQLEIA